MAGAIITGSSRGIGRAVARRFADDGYDVIINYRNNAEMATSVAETIDRETSREARVVKADVSDPGDAEALITTSVEELGSIDHLVNNAGIDQHVYTEQLPPTDFDRILDVNVNGAFNVTKAALSYLRESAVPEGPSITNISSILAYTGAPIECHYAASKAGLLGLTKSHARDFAPTIRVNAVAPGHIETDMTADRTPAEANRERQQIPLGRFGQPEDIADAVAYLRDAGFVTGETLNVNGGELMR
ncbi:SDR family NAD(P)-dependent oxidoreductase [Haladaptatus caseinilyticus]|uniref:SDR family NAD(P)-dependent oxidoreductase n=1 Tax=Haladaptatus caseinilyticus TaxID=2993314 RepID=UPI00224A756E|nr:3-oxoacyl-ACP reductase family protein [Haladaptatus caseinilyticus]